MKLSYAGSDVGTLSCAAITLIEKLSGARKLQKAARRFESSEPEDKTEASSDFFRRAAIALELTVKVHEKSSGTIPASGGLLVAANHPFGIMDGLAIAHLIEHVRSDLKIVVWDAIRIPEKHQQHFIPLDLEESSRQARRQNVRARREMIDHLRAGGALLLFPSGSAAMSERAFSTPEEMSWTPMMSRIARSSGAMVLPVYISGNNTRLFHVLTRVSLLIRRALFVCETVQCMGSVIKPVISTPINWTVFADTVGDDSTATALLRKEVLAMASVNDEARGNNSSFEGESVSTLSEPSAVVTQSTVT